MAGVRSQGKGRRCEPAGRLTVRLFLGELRDTNYRSLQGRPPFNGQAAQRAENTDRRVSEGREVACRFLCCYGADETKKQTPHLAFSICLLLAASPYRSSLASTFSARYSRSFFFFFFFLLLGALPFYRVRGRKGFFIKGERVDRQSTCPVTEFFGS